MLKILGLLDSVHTMSDPPIELCCPITKVLLKHPVKGTDGHTYEKTALRRWLRMKGTSPLTRQPMTFEKDLSMLKKLAEYRVSSGLASAAEVYMYTQLGDLDLQNHDLEGYCEGEVPDENCVFDLRYPTLQRAYSHSVYAHIVEHEGQRCLAVYQALAGGDHGAKFYHLGNEGDLICFTTRIARIFEHYRQLEPCLKEVPAGRGHTYGLCEILKPVSQPCCFECHGRSGKKRRRAEL
jgi:hypothetical protein